MSGSDKRLVAVDDIRLALALLCRVPLPGGALSTDRSAYAVWAYPVVGLLIGGIAGGIGTLALALGLPAALSAGMALVVQIVVTGALHEDGLADTADGLWGGWDRARRLEIMRDSRIGTYGVIALILSIILRWSALTILAEADLLWPTMLAAAALSRSAMPPLMAGLANARQDGLSHQVGRPSWRSAGFAAALGAGICLFAIGFWGLVMIAAASVAALGAARIAQSKIGGQTGDVLGATQQLAEMSALIALIAVLH